MKDTRYYWQHPSLASQLPKEEREKVTAKFFELLAKNEEKNAEWRSKVVKERNKNLPHTCAPPSKS